MKFRIFELTFFSDFFLQIYLFWEETYQCPNFGPRIFFLYLQFTRFQRKTIKTIFRFFLLNYRFENYIQVLRHWKRSYVILAKLFIPKPVGKLS